MLVWIYLNGSRCFFIIKINFKINELLSQDIYEYNNVYFTEPSQYCHLSIKRINIIVYFLLSLSLYAFYNYLEIVSHKKQTNKNQNCTEIEFTNIRKELQLCQNP